jgi:hypothetical protein
VPLISLERFVPVIVTTDRGEPRPRPERHSGTDLVAAEVQGVGLKSHHTRSGTARGGRRSDVEALVHRAVSVACVVRETSSVRDFRLIEVLRVTPSSLDGKLGGIRISRNEIRG